MFTENQIDLIYVIVNQGTGSQILKKARQLGVTGGTIFHGKGTFRNKWLSLFCLNDVHREIVWLLVDDFKSSAILQELTTIFHLTDANKGIAFSVSLDNSQIQGEKVMFELITVIVEKGVAEEVIEVANSAGATGATIINARGAGVHETSKVFNMEVEPEKETILLLANVETSPTIQEAIRKAGKIDEPGRGLLFVQAIKEAYGMYKNN